MTVRKAASEARAQILGSIRKARRRDGPLSDAAALDDRLRQHPRNVVPARATGDRDTLLDLFQNMAESVHATVERVAGADAVPAAVTDYLKGENLPARAVMAPDPALDDVPWQAAPLLELRRGMPVAEDLVGLTSAFAAVAETGTLVMLSGPAHPSTLNFLPETHIVVVATERLVGAYEDALDRIRAAGDTLPRTVNMITGPSRSGDIEQTLQLGAHGPRRLHVILVGDGQG